MIFHCRQSCCYRNYHTFAVLSIERFLLHIGIMFPHYLVPFVWHFVSTTKTHFRWGLGMENIVIKTLWGNLFLPLVILLSPLYESERCPQWSKLCWHFWDISICITFFIITRLCLSFAMCYSISTYGTAYGNVTGPYFWNHFNSTIFYFWSDLIFYQQPST